MSDTGRKSMTEQVGDKMKPESQKTATERLGGNLSGATDRVAGAVQPESQKSTTQKMGDSMRSGGDQASSQGKGLTQSVTDTVSGATQSAKDTLSGAMGTDSSKPNPRK